MRTLLVVAALLGAAAVGTAGHATYLDKSVVTECMLQVQAPGVFLAFNCPGILDGAPAAEPAGGSYRLTVTWSAADPQWASLRADLASCDTACPPPGSGVCVNNQCVGNPSPPAGVVQQAAASGGSPLVLSIPTAGNESLVQLGIRPASPVVASLAQQGIAYKLEHVG